jgi:hypothetical protein
MVEAESVLARLLGRELPDRIDRDARALGAPAPADVITEDEVAGLPATVQRYLRFMGVVGCPAVTSFRAHLRGEFRMRPGQRFMRTEVWQYNTAAPIARVFWMRIDMAGGLLPMVGRDSYIKGHGRMLGKLFDTVVVADGEGEPFDIGELTTWLNDAVLMAPSMLLRAPVSFVEVDDDSFAVSLSDAGRTVSARVVLDERGGPVDFRTEDRYADLPGGPVRTPWSTPVDGWRGMDGRQVPTRGSAVWHLPEGDFTYAVLEFTPDSVERNPIVGGAEGQHATRSGAWDVVRGGSAVAYTLVGSPWLREQYNRWGASQQEWTDAMPGDDLVPQPVLLSTRTVTIDAPPSAVWPWLAQIGQGRGGLYSYDALENLMGLDIHSTDTLLPESQQLAPGDLVRLGKPGSPSFCVMSLEANRSLVLVSADPVTGEPVPTPVRDGTGATWQWVLRPIRGGTATRLVSRQRNTHPRGQRMLWRLVEPIGFVMERRMLLGIKERVERVIVRYEQ